MELVTGATSSLLPKLGALLQDEYQLQDKVKKEFESLQNELIFMRVTLRMVAEVPQDQLDEHVRIWSVLIREISYDIEDEVNIFSAHKQLALDLIDFIQKAFNMLCMGRTHHEIASMVKEIRSLINEVAGLRDRYRLDNIVTRPATPTPIVVPQRDNMFVSYFAADREEITRRHIGIKYQEPMAVDEDMKVLHNWITSGDDQTTLCLVGPARVGKTTIAMALYQNYGDQFQRRVMVKLSQDSRVHKPFLVDILSQLKRQELQGHDGDTCKIRYELQECLRGKRFLIIVDDVWSVSIFDQIRSLLPKNEKGSRVILTTRFNAVASQCGRNTGVCVHQVGLLTDEKAKQLFMEVAGKENQKKIPLELWEMCNGLRSNIVKMAQLVASNPDKSDEEWGEVHIALARRPYYSSDTENQLMNIFSTRYNDMPVEIKACALYLSMFPRGQKVSKKRLTRRWISGGLVIEQLGFSAEEVAETYLNHLIRRTFIRATEHSSNGKVKSYQVSDMALKYIVSKASEENFVTVLGGYGTGPPSMKIRRLSVQCSGSNYGNELETRREELRTMNLSHVRDLTMFGSLNQLPSNSLKFGRVVQLLDLEGCKDFKQHHTKEICKMFLLKYLSLRRTDIKKLTKRIGDLQFLETLDIRETYVIELPSAIFKLERLINIFGGNKRTRKGFKLPNELRRCGSMKALRILSGIEISEETTADLHHLTDLRKLTIYKLDIKMGGSPFRALSSSIEYLGAFSLRALVIHDESAEFLKSLGRLSSPQVSQCSRVVWQVG